MKTYVVSYDLKKPDKDYVGLINEIKNTYQWWHYLDSTWLVHSSESASAVFQRLHPYIDKDDYILIIEAGRDRQGWLPEKAWKWIKAKIG